MAQFRAISRRRTVDQIVQQFNNNTDRLKREVYHEMAEEVADITRAKAIREENPRRGAVDTGTFARNMEVAARSGSFAGDVDSPKEQDKRGVVPGPPIRAGLNQMRGDIDKLPKDNTNVVFRNRAAHAGLVEQRYKIYAQARNTAPQIIKSVAARLGLAPKGGGG